MKSILYIVIMNILLACGNVSHAHPHGFLKAHLTLEIYSNTLHGTITADIDRMNARHLARGGISTEKMQQRFASFILAKNNDTPLIVSNYNPIIKNASKNPRVPVVQFQSTFTAQSVEPLETLSIFFFDDSYYFMTTITNFDISTNSTAVIQTIAEDTITNPSRLPVIGRRISIQQEDIQVSMVSTNAPAAEQPVTSPLTRLLRYFGEVLQTLQEQFEKVFSKSSENMTPRSLFLLMGLSLLWGIFHAMGPGHSKTLIASYLLHNKSTCQNAIWFAVLISFFHTGGAILLAVILGRLSTAGILLADVNGYATRISGMAILTIGLFLAIGFFRKKQHQTPVANQRKSIFMLALAGGIVPCPMSMLILFLAISTGHIPLGILAIICFGTGMCVTEIAIGLITVHYQHALIRHTRSPGIFQSVYTVFRLGGIIMILAIGLIMSLPI